MEGQGGDIILIVMCCRKDKKKTPCLSKAFSVITLTCYEASLEDYCILVKGVKI